MARSTLCLCVGLVFVHCGGPPKYRPPDIQARFHKVYVEPFKNMSTIELADGFPKDSTRVYILFQEIEKAHWAMVRELNLRAKNGKYTLVEKEEYPTMVVTPVLMPYKIEGTNLKLPVFITVTNQETNEKVKRQFDIEVRYPESEQPENMYHFWGVMLGEWRRHFPKKEIAKLFYAQPVKQEEE